MEKNMTPRSKNIREFMEKINWWRRRKATMKKSNVSPIIGNFLTNELAGNARDHRNKPDPWMPRTQMGMDKIRASSDFGQYCADFASSSTVHGFNHLAAPHRHPIERFLTVVVIVVAFSSLILLSANFWDRFQNGATIFILDRDFRHYTVIKPAVLLCPTVRINVAMFPDVFKRHGIEDTTEAREFFTFIAGATYLNMEDTPPYTGAKPDKWLTVIWELKSDPKVNNLDDGSEGTWIVTERGLCQIFFSTVADYSSYTYWMQNNWTIIPQSGKRASLTWKTHEIGRALTVKYDAVHVSAYNPQEVPEFEKPGMHAPQRHINAMEFIPQEIGSSTDVIQLTPYQRKCKTLSEGGLTMWPVYTRNMCIAECRYGLIREHCGCHPFFARPMHGIPICNADQQRCIAKHRSQFVKINSSVAETCGCYANCDTSSYTAKGNKQTNLNSGAPNDTICNVHLEFPKQKVRRELLFGFHDFMASVGGAAGLFLGGSVISFVEFLYWATLRLYWYRINLRREREAKTKLRQKFYDKITTGSSNDSFHRSQTSTAQKG